MFNKKIENKDKDMYISIRIIIKMENNSNLTQENISNENANINEINDNGYHFIYNFDQYGEVTIQRRNEQENNSLLLDNNRYMNVHTSVYSFEYEYKESERKEDIIETEIEILNNVEKAIQKECSICMDKKSRALFVKLNCKHEFCGDCSYKSLNYNKLNNMNNTCALCRNPIETIIVRDNDIFCKIEQIRT